MKSESGIIGTLAASWSYYHADNSTIIYGEKGILRLEEDPEFSLIAQYTDGEVVKYELDKIQTNDAGASTALTSSTPLSEVLLTMKNRR